MNAGERGGGAVMRVDVHPRVCGYTFCTRFSPTTALSPPKNILDLSPFVSPVKLNMGDDEASVLAHLSLLLSTQSLGFTDAGDAESTKELLAKMGGELEGVTVGEERGGGRGNSVRVEMPNRKTPYEVWAEGRQQEVVRVRMLVEGKGTERQSSDKANTLNCFSSSFFPFLHSFLRSSLKLFSHTIYILTLPLPPSTSLFLLPLFSFSSLSLLLFCSDAPQAQGY